MEIGKRERRAPPNFDDDEPPLKSVRVTLGGAGAFSSPPRGAADAGDAAPAPAAAAAAAPPSAELDAVMALQGLCAFAAPPTAPPAAYAPPAAPPAAVGPLMSRRAIDVSRFDDESEVWPMVRGKGWFVKSPGGVELPFLERLYLLLSFPNAALYSCPGRRVGEAIRWKEGDEAWRAGAPHGVDCFEIVDVPLFEAELYPQYASGSFNKTAGKWGFVSPAPDAAAVRNKMSRECMYLDPSAVPGAAAAFRRLAADATVGQVYEHVRNHIKPFQRAPAAPPAARKAPAAPPVRAADSTDSTLVKQILKTVKQTANYELSDEQLSMILAFKTTDAAPAAAAAPRPAAAAPAVAAPPPVDTSKEAMLAQSSLPPLPAGAPRASWGELHVTLWDKVRKKRVPGTSYTGDLITHLKANPHLEVYNRQDERRGQVGHQLLAGQKTQTFAPTTPERQRGVAPTDLKVVMWHTREQRKLRPDEAPTQSQLVQFLRENPDVAVYDGQVATVYTATPVDDDEIALKKPLKPEKAANDEKPKPEKKPLKKEKEATPAVDEVDATIDAAPDAAAPLVSAEAIVAPPPPAPAAAAALRLDHAAVLTELAAPPAVAAAAPAPPPVAPPAAPPAAVVASAHGAGGFDAAASMLDLMASVADDAAPAPAGAHGGGGQSTCELLQSAVGLLAHVGTSPAEPRDAARPTTPLLSDRDASALYDPLAPPPMAAEAAPKPARGGTKVKVNHALAMQAPGLAQLASIAQIASAPVKAKAPRAPKPKAPPKPKSSFRWKTSVVWQPPK